MPRLDQPWEDVEVELKAKHAEIDAGCVYYSRCPYASAKCLGKPPALEAEPNHLVACWKAFDDLDPTPAVHPTD